MKLNKKNEMAEGMKIKVSTMIILMIIAGCLFLLTACRNAGPIEHTGELTTDRVSLDGEGVEFVNVEIAMGAGSLSINSGAEGLLEGSFRYNLPELKPTVEFANDQLNISMLKNTGRTKIMNIHGLQNEWDLLISNDIPMEMSILVGAGSAHLNMGDLKIRGLDLDIGSGELILDLSDSIELSYLRINTGVGKTLLDLTGDWQSDVDINIETGIGELFVHLPGSICVQVSVDGGITNMDMTQLQNVDGEYPNRHCGTSEETMRVEISTGIGEVTLNLNE